MECAGNSQFLTDFELDQGIGFLDVGGGSHLQIYLYDPTTSVLTTWDKTCSFDIAPGRSYKVGLTTTKFRDESGFSGCIEEGKTNELKYYDKGYAHMLCVSECFTETEFKTCDCITLTQSFFPNDTLECATATMTMCQIDDVELLRQCQATCKPQCSFTKYYLDISSAKFPSQSFANLQSAITQTNNVSYQYMRRNYAEVTIQFSSLTVKHTNIYPKYEIFSASSAMGGLLGLLLGGSMMTVYELAEFIVNPIYTCFKIVILKTKINQPI
ncbi:bile acid-sensitive ion channel-like [Convolutriloba macropyga]|uniref:bile acid-sensitive ion channel-like n=1 Tax=Convolutriloba macropyga TaxID=536237 RepID=UPI003F51DE65